MMQECLARHRRRWDSVAWIQNPAVRKAIQRWVVFRSHYLRQMIREEIKRQLVTRRKAKKRKAKERGKSVNGKSRSNANGKASRKS